MITNATYAGSSNTMVDTDLGILPVTDERVQNWVVQGNEIQPYVEPPKTQEEIINEVTVAVQAHLDSQAQSLGYDNIHTAVTYADESAVVKFQNEGIGLRSWRSNVWDTCYQLLDAGNPMTADEVIAQLPAYVPFTG